MKIKLPLVNLNICRMPYTEATLLEVQRMANVVPITVRAPSQDTKIGQYEIKKVLKRLIKSLAIFFSF